MEEYPTDFVSIGTVEDVYTTHVTHQEQFYVHLDTRSRILEEIMDKLETRYSHLGPNDKTLPQIKPGGLCAAKFTDDNNWYRAKVTGVHNNGLIEVNFVDYGSTDYVGADRVKKLDIDLMHYPVQSYRCALSGVSCPHGLWTPELRVQFEDLVIDKQCTAVFKEKAGEDIYQLDMFDEQGNHINRLFGAPERKKPVANIQATRNGRHTEQGFDTVVWKEGQIVPAIVVYVKSPDLFWCQEVVHTNNILVLSEELSRLHMTQEMGPLQDIRPGAICAAKFHVDDDWYRGIIQSLSRNEAQVYFVDYGNTETVALNYICELKPQFRILPALAVKCSLSSPGSPGGGIWGPGATDEFEKLVVDKELELNVLQRQPDGYNVSLLDVVENRDVGNQLKDKILNRGGIKSKSSTNIDKVNNNNSNSQSQSKSRGLDFNVGSTSDVFLSWIDNPSDFWVQLDSASDTLDKLSSDLQEYYAQPRPAALSAPGAFVIARYSEDQRWYRGLVVKEFDDVVKVLFIDYGNTDTIPKSELRQVNPQFGQIDPLAFRCSLKGIKPLPQDNSWSVDAKDFLEKLTENGCQCEVLSKNEAYRFVNLKADGRDITQELVSLAVVAGSQLPTTKSTSQSYLPGSKLDENQTEQVLVTHIDSPHCIWVQLKKSSSDLDVVMEKLENHYSEEGGTPITRPAVGQACVAQYSLDSAWYRAVIMNITPSGCNVHFVDYGNKELVAPSKVCLAEPRFLDLPSQAIRCSLPLQGDVSNLTDMLSDLVLEKDVSLKVLAVGGEVPTVDLIVEGESVCGLLRIRGASFGNVSGKSSGHEGGNVQVIKSVKPIPEGSTVVAFTSMVHNPGRFFLQLSGIDDELSSLMDRIATKYVPQGIPLVSQPSVGTYCVALYQDDNQWYRGKITSANGDTCQILFVDYGNEEFVEIGSVKVMIPEISNCPILAYECSLHGIHADEWSESSIEYFESIVMDQELKCTFNTQSQVTISCNGEDVATKLVSAGHCRRVTPAANSPLAVSTSGFGGGSRPKNSPGFGQSPKKEEISPRGFGGGKRDERGFRENREENREFGGRRQHNFGEGRDEKREFGGGGNRFGEDRENKRGFGGERRDGRGFGGEGREDRGGRRFGGGDESGSHRSDEGSEKGGFKSRSRDGEDSGFGGRRGGGDGGTGFGGGRRERNVSADSSASGATADKFTYADPPSGPESAILVHIDDDGTFYLQLPSMEKDILFLSKRLAGSYKSGGPRLKGTAEKGTICCCKFPDDGSMYRCQVEGIDGNKVLVRYMDFGNIAEHSTYDLKYLFPDLLQYPAQAFPCKLRGLDWSLDQAEKFASVTLDKDLEVTFTSKSAPFEVDIKTPDGDLLSIMTGKIAPPAPKICSPSQGGGAFGAKSPKGFGSRGGMDTSTPKKFDSPVKSLNLTSSSPVKPSLPKQIFISQTAPLESQTAFISHISEDGHFYLQFEKDTDLLESLTEKLRNLDSNTPHPDLSKGAACGAVFSEDSSWYRAKITEVTNDQCIVTFVDFGNGDKVSKQNIRPLSGDLLTAAPLAYQCSFAGEDEALSNESKEKLEEFLMEHQLTVSFNNQSAPFTVSAKTSDGQDLRDIVCPSNQFRSHIIPKDVTPVGVSHIEEDGRFFVSFYKQYKAKENLQKRLSEHYSSADVESVENPEIDSPCCFKSTVDDQWHRCIIKSLNDSKAEVRYVDWGKQDSADTSDLKLLPLNFLKEPPFALECRLKGVESWTDDLKEKFIDMTKDKILNATFYTSKPPYRVSLARSIELDLLGLSAPEPDSPRKMVDDSVVSNANMNRSAVFQGGDCYITETTPEGMFYAQLVSEEDQLQSLSDSLDALLATEHTEPDTVEVGNVLSAKFTEDDVWYRASVEEVDGDNFTVRFVDYGNTDNLSKNRLASLPDELSTISIPAFAYKCKLSSPLSSVEEFKGAVLDKVVSIEIVSSEEDSVFSVNVTHNGLPIGGNEATAEGPSNIQEEIVKSGSSERKAVIVPFVTSPGQFYVQLQNDENQLDSMMNDLYEDITGLAEGEGLVLGDLAIGDLCAALYEESWYRVKVISFGEGDQSVQVLYVDHGNTETVSDRADLRALPDKYQSLPLFGHEATLSGVKPVDEDWTEEAIEAFRALVEEKSLLADLLDVNDKPWVVQLLDMGTPVQDTLIAKGYAVATGSFNISKSTKQVFSENESSMMVTEAFVPNESDKIWKNKIGCISDKVEELKEVKAFVSHADNPSQIWCQLASSSDELEELADRMETLYSTPQDSDNIIGDISNGDLVVGLFEDDGSRYRSVVVSKNSDNGKVLLRFIDYGNCGLCSRDQIFNIREELCNQPALSFSCCLDKIQPLEEEWSSEVCNRFAELTTDQELLLTLVGRKQDGTALIDLIVPETGKSLSDVLIEEGLVNKSLDIDSSLPVARHDTDKCDESECLEITQPIMESTAMVDEATPNKYQDYSFGYADDGYYRCIELNLHSSYAITVCNDELPNAFCVQLKELEVQLSTLTAEIQEYVDSHVDDDYSPKIGDPCLVQHENKWQRTLIRMICNDSSYIVYAVDIGWELSVKRDKIRSMPTQFLDLPGQAIHCYLAGVVSLEPEWSLEAIDFFTDYIKDYDHHINVLESAEDGKYGVSMTTMQDSSTEYTGASLNQLMVDLGYSDVVPGSNLEVQYDMERTLDSDMLDELEESFKGVETEKNMENKEKSSETDDGIDNGEKSDIYGQNEEISKCLIKMEFNKLNNGTVNVNEGSNTPNDPSEHGNVNNVLEIDPNEVVQALSITQEEKQLLPYEYYEKLESQSIKDVNGSDVHSNLCEVDCIENYLQTDTKSKDGETSLVHNAHILTVYQAGSHISDAKMDGSTIEDIVEDMDAERGDIGRSLTDQIDCNGIALEKDRNEFENYQDVIASGDETLETFEYEDASYLTIDQTGYVDIDNEAGLTDGYHGSPSDGVSGTDVLPSDFTHSLEEDNSLRDINSVVKDSDNNKNLYGVQACEQFEDSFVENENCEVESVSYDIAKVMSSGNFIMGICYEEDGEIPTTIRCQLNVKDSMEEHVKKTNNQTESTYVEHGMNIGVINKDDIQDSELCVGRRENSNSLIKSSVIKDIDGYLDRDTEKDSALTNFEEQEIEVMDVCDGTTEAENEEMDVCEGNVGGIPENISSSGAFNVKYSTENINSFLSNEMKFGLIDDEKSIDLLEVATPGSPDGNSFEGSMFESCLEPNSSGSCQEGIINDQCQASDVAVDLEEISVQEIKKEESLACVDPKCTSVVEAISAWGGEEEKEGDDGHITSVSTLDDGRITSVSTLDDGHITSVSTLDDTYDNYESASETFEDFDRTESFYNSSGCLVIDESTDLTDSSLDRSGLESSDCGPESSSCYDTSSLVFSDSQLDSSYADTSNTSASTQTTEVSGYSIVDTSTFSDTSTSQCDESDLTAEEGSASSLSLNCAVKLSSDSKLFKQGESFIDTQNVSTEVLEKSKICENQERDNQVYDAQQISTLRSGGENEYEQGQDVGNSNIRTSDDDFISSAARQIPLNEPEQHRNKTEDHDRVNKDNGDAVVMTCRNEVVIDDQDEEKGDEVQMPEMAKAFRNEPLSQSLSYRVERDDTNTDKGSKVDSEHSGPASFHSVDDEEEEVIRGNLEESDTADVDIDENDTDGVETNESEGQEPTKAIDEDPCINVEENEGKNTLDAESKESNEAETKENVNDEEGQQLLKATEKVPNEESRDIDMKDEMDQCDITAKKVKVVQSYDEAEAESIADKDESEA